MSSNHNYMVYTRDEGGRITREHLTVALSAGDIKNDYPNPEKLSGWPETIVYWSTPHGLGNGRAPLSKAAAESLKD
jgi:hypothetical protein